MKSRKQKSYRRGTKKTVAQGARKQKFQIKTLKSEECKLVKKRGAGGWIFPRCENKGCSGVCQYSYKFIIIDGEIRGIIERCTCFR